MKKTIYYKDELNEEFSGITRNTIKIDGNFKYIKKSPLWNFLAFIFYRLFMVPFGFLYLKIKFGHKTVNKKVIKNVKDSSYFMYGNHTLMAGDAFIPHLINQPRKSYTVVHADNISKKGLKNFILMNGAMPLPATKDATKNFLEAMEKRLVQGCPIIIYPEAHIWPYYTKIRPFKSTAFRYAVKFEEPVFAITNTFSKRKFRKTPKVTTYVDGPFYPDATLNPKQQEQDLRDKVYNAMVERSKNSTYEYVKYVKVEETND